MIRGFVFVLIECLTCIGVGGLLAWLYTRWTKSDDLENLSVGDFGLAGVAALSALAVTVNLFVPIKLLLSQFITAAGAIGAISLFWLLPRYRLRLLGSFFALCLIVAFTMILRYGLYEGIFDFWLYHHHAIKVYEEHPALFGVANVHGRLGFASSTFGFAALLDFWRDRHAGEFATNYAAFSLLLLMLLSAMRRPRSPEVNDNFILRIFAVAAFVVLFWKSGLDNYVSTANNELIPAAFTLYVCVLLLRLYGNRWVGVYGNRLTLILLALAASTAFTGKLSNATSVLVAGAMVILIFGRDLWLSKKLLIPSVVAACIVVLPSLLRTFIQTGCWLYPIKSTCMFDVSWAVSAKHVLIEQAWIKAWPRAGASHMSTLKSSEWMLPWLQGNFNFTNLFSWTVIAIASFFLLQGLRLVYKFEKPAKRDLNYLAVFVAAMTLALVFWFTNAPDPRFAMGTFISAFALSITGVVVLLRNVLPIVSTLQDRILTLAVLASIAATIGPAFKSRIGDFKLTYPFPHDHFPERAFTVDTFGEEEKVQIYSIGDICCDLPLFCTPTQKNDLTGIGITKYLGRLHFNSAEMNKTKTDPWLDF